jgi:hypothetical protein
MNSFDKNTLYKFASICSALAALYFLGSGVSSGFDSNSITLSIVFMANTIIFSSIKN